MVHALLMIHVSTALIRNTGRTVNRIAKPGVKTVYATEMAAAFLVIMCNFMGRHVTCTVTAVYMVALTAMV